MAKSQNVSKSQAVRDYAKNHPTATSGEIAKALSKQGVKLTPHYVANIKAMLNKTRSAKKAKVVPVLEAEPEKTAKASATVTLEQVKAVATKVKALGGCGQVNDLLVIIKEIGGVKKFKDLLEAMWPTEPDVVPF